MQKKYGYHFHENMGQCLVFRAQNIIQSFVIVFEKKSEKQS